MNIDLESTLECPRDTTKTVDAAHVVCMTTSIEYKDGLFKQQKIIYDTYMCVYSTRTCQ